MSYEYKLPDVGEGLTEAEIVSWRVKEGDVIEVNDVVVEIETAKSIVELPSPYAGTVLALLVPEGETVEVGTPIIRIGEPGEAAAAPSPAESPAPSAESAPSAEPAPTPSAAPSPAPSPTPEMEIDLSNPAASGSGEGESLVGRSRAERGPQRRRRRGAATPASEAGMASQLQLQGAFAPGGAQSGEVSPADEPPVPAAPVGEEPPATVRALATPPVRKLAKEHGVDLTQVQGTGPQGSVTRRDVMDFLEEAPAAARPIEVVGTTVGGFVGTQPGERERREPIKGVRKMMGQAMVQSAFTAPHVTEWVTVDVTRTTEFVERLRSDRAFEGVKVSPLLVLARAAMLAMRRTPEINSVWDDDGQEIVYKGYVNLGIAAATPRGLVVPNVKDADSLSLRDLAVALNDLVATARAGKTQPAEMGGGTFTITNVGVFGVDAGTPIINPGESAILCFGAVRRQPWVVSDRDGERLEIRSVCTLALSFDHRHIDGEKGSRFLADVARIMEDPAAALLF